MAGKGPSSKALRQEFTSPVGMFCRYKFSLPKFFRYGVHKTLTNVVMCGVIASSLRFIIFLDVFRKYLPQDAACIELFARNLLPNWTSWGNEVRVLRCLIQK